MAAKQRMRGFLAAWMHSRKYRYKFNYSWNLKHFNKYVQQYFKARVTK